MDQVDRLDVVGNVNIAIKYINLEFLKDYVFGATENYNLRKMLLSISISTI